MKSVTSLLWTKLLLFTVSLSSFGKLLAFSVKSNSNDFKIVTKAVHGLFATQHKTMTNAILASVPTILTSGAALAEVDDSLDGVELAELPPPFVPLIFAFALLIGVGVLTSSLGDVYSEEASLGMQSGAQAKKERERSRASYFKKR